MAQIKTTANLQHILSLWQGTADRNPEQLFTTLVDMLSTPEELPSPVARQDALLLLKDLRSKIRPVVRMSLAAKLSRMKDIPRDLLIFFARDESNIAAPILRHKKELDDTILLNIAQEGSPAHRHLLSLRQNLSATVKRALEQFSENPDFLQQEAEDSGATADHETVSTPDQFHIEPLQKKRLREVREGQNWLEDIARAATDWAFETDGKGNLTYLSKSVLSVFGKPAALLCGRPLTTLGTFIPVEGKQEGSTSPFKGRRPFRGRIFKTEPSGQDAINWSLNAVPLFDIESGKFLGYRGTAVRLQPVEIPTEILMKNEDFSSLHQSIEKINQENVSLQTVLSENKQYYSRESEKLSNLSHEFRTPLNAIMGFSQMIQGGMLGPVNGKYRDYAKTILNAARGLNHLIGDVLDNAKLEVGSLKIEREMCPLHPPIQKCLADFPTQPKIDGLQKADGISVYTDEHRLIQMISAILRTLLRYPTKSALLFDLDRDGEGNIRLMFINPGAQIDVSELAELFKPIAHKQVNGNDRPVVAPGFSLNLARDIAHLLEGDMMAGTTKNGGLRLILRLPENEPHHPTKSRAVPAHSPA